MLTMGMHLHWKQAMNDYTARDKKNYGDTDVAKLLTPNSSKSYLFARIYSMDTIILNLSVAQIWSVPRQLVVL